MARLAITKDVLSEYAQLDEDAQRTAEAVITGFASDPHAGTHLEKVPGSRDDRLRLIQLADPWSGVVLVPDRGDTYCLLRILPWDQAAAYAASHRVSVNPATGMFEISDQAALQQLQPARQMVADPAARRLFADVSDADLTRLGIDAQMWPLVRLLASEAGLDALQPMLPDAQYGALHALASGMTVEEAWTDLTQSLDGSALPGSPDSDDLVSALERAPGQVAFVSGQEELRFILAHPFAAWRTFLHPSQRDIAYRPSYSGPAQVTGGPGTGKTVTVLHRAAFLAARDNTSPVLLTTFNGNLADALHAQLDLLIQDAGVRRRIDVINVDRLAYSIVKQARGTPVIADERMLRACWAEIAEAAGLELTPAFLKNEWEQVILAQDLHNEQAYLTCLRTGRGRPLTKAQRSRVWQAAQQLTAELAAVRQATHLQLANEATHLLRQAAAPRYRHILVDEAQDLHPSQWRLLRAAVAEGPDDLFIAADPHQRIYNNRVSLASLRISVRGRSRKLSLNYRTTQEILAWAMPLLGTQPVTGLDGEADSLLGYRSPMHGPPPQVREAATRREEFALLAERIRSWLASGIEPYAIGVAARSASLVREAREALEADGIGTGSVSGRRNPTAVRAGTMHAMKGLEFQAVAVIGVEEGAVPELAAVTAEGEDPLAHAQDLQRERCVLFVACTRARDHLYVSGTGSLSPFLPSRPADPAPGAPGGPGAAVPAGDGLAPENELAEQTAIATPRAEEPDAGATEARSAFLLAASKRNVGSGMRKPVIEFRVGQFVQAAGQQLGIGKCLHVSGDEVEIEYFDSISATGRHRATARRSQVEPVQVGPQRRCYWEDKTDWRVGRVVWQGDGQYGVRPPNSDADLMVSEEELYVRWNKPIDDPTDVLLARGNESPYFHLRRYPFVATTTRQRAASHGMHGVISSVIDLYDHQIEVARRVLEDPKQRYLLADEVGLGKTIEAGIIIRQYLLDHPEGHVVVITPPLLRRQWVSELRQKFLIDDFDRAVVSVLSHDKPESWLEGARDGLGRFSRHIKAGLVVVDEAHHLAALASAGGDAGNRYAVLAALTAAVPRLLLLSATPLLNNERTFLAMLHLLDPDIYLLHDIEGFRRRIRDRQALGTAFFTFRPDIPPFLLRDKVSALRTMFPGDEQLAALLDRVSAALGDPSALPDAVMAARIHISETYRVHRRLLRTRRNDTILDDFPVRGRQRPVTIPLADPDEATQEWLDDWRDYVRSTLDSSPTARVGARRAFIALAERAGSHPGLAATAARYRLEPSASHAHRAELTPAEQDALSSWAADDMEREILERGSRLEIDPEILPALVRFLKDARRKTVVFTSFTMTARYVRDALASEFGPHAIAAHLTDEDPAAVEEEVDRFRDAAGDCWILVCDRSAEEGRNFQFADQAIHFDLPFSPNRLEQRIGRLDRYGRGSVIPTYAIESVPGMITAAWKDCLTEGFGVFDTSIASLQFAIDALLPELHDALLDDGAAGLARMTEILPGRLAAEREAIAEQDALDAIEADDRAAGFASAMKDVEDSWLRIQHSTEGLLCDGPGNLRFHLVADQKDDRYRSYRLTALGKTPHLNSMPLVAWDVLRARFAPVVKRTGTYSRAAAVERPDARLFRIGEPLVDSLADYIRWDDRGQTFAFWRTSPDIADESLYFRFDYVIEADTGPAELVLETRGSTFDRRSLQRRADAFLPPKIVTLWSAIDGTHLEDRKLTGLLQAPYEPKRGDINLNPERRWALDELIGESDWEWRCRTARAHSEETLRHQSAFAAACADAATRFEAASQTAVTQRRIRLTFLPGRQRKAEESELAADIDIDAALSLGMREPHVRLDAVGAVVLAPVKPEGPGFARPRT